MRMVKVYFEISPLYQYIMHFNNQGIPSGAGDANYFELLLDQILVHFNKLMEAYQYEEAQK